MTVDQAARVTSHIGEEWFSVFPLDYDGPGWDIARDLTIRVVWKGPGSYAVVWRGCMFLSTAGNWNYLPPARMRKWHRFPYGQACDLAREWAPKIAIGGRTAVQWLQEVSR